MKSGEIIEFYGEIYRCEECTKIPAIDPDGLSEFIRSGDKQTFPVSHFGDIISSKIWIIATNPKGDRNDPNVGHLAKDYNQLSRKSISREDTEQVFKHFCKYFENNHNIHSFFDPYMKLLDNINFKGQNLTFAKGEICVVDAIKCPTVKDWQGYVRSEEGKAVWYNCLGNKSKPGPNRFLIRQIELHEPLILIFPGTGGLVPVDSKGTRKNRFDYEIPIEISNLITEVRTHENANRISFIFSGAKRLLNASDHLKEEIRIFMQDVINDYY